MYCCFRALNAKITIEKQTAVTHLPGFKYDDFDRAGIICIVCYLSRVCRWSTVFVHVFWFVLVLCIYSKFQIESNSWLLLDSIQNQSQLPHFDPTPLELS